MKAGEIVLLRLPEANVSSGKLRPVLVLSDLPAPFGDYLVCGISSQLHQEMPDWDERLTTSDDDFAASGLKVPSVIRPSASAGTLGSITSERLTRLRRRLATYLS